MKNPFKRLALKIVIEHAIQREEDSFHLYTAAADRITAASSRKLLKELAGEELAHRLKLESIQQNKDWKKTQKIEVPWDEVKYKQLAQGSSPAIGPEEKKILADALEREQDTFTYYSGIAEKMGPGELKDVFLLLAGEEGKHMDKIEKMLQKVSG